MKILILTVGGSHQPILKSISSNKPDFVAFLCSADAEPRKSSYLDVEGEGMVLKSTFDQKKPDMPNIVTQAGIRREGYQAVKIDKYDNLNDCYLAAWELIKRLRDEHLDATIICDYTGGTKSMTAGLAAAAIDDGNCELKLVGGQRDDKVKVTDGTEMSLPAQVLDVQALRCIEAARPLIERFDYAGAEHILEEAALHFATDTTKENLQRWVSLCRGFNAWDRFDHATAQTLLQPYKQDFMDHFIFLTDIQGGRGHGFEVVEDLLMNAERRAQQGRFDDATGRFYRALELTAQIWLLRKHKVSTDNIDLKRVPDSIRPELEGRKNSDGIVQTGLMDSWRLIAAFNGDPLGELFKRYSGKIRNEFLAVRNQSLFAHGLKPIGKEQYLYKMKPLVDGFLQQAIDLAVANSGNKKRRGITQLPNAWD